MTSLRSWNCPQCGAAISLPGEWTEGKGELSNQDLDRMAHAVCGCYVLEMADGAVARLLSSLLMTPEPECMTPKGEWSSGSEASLVEQPARIEARD